jgi:D-lactate dehydrogenase
MLPVVWLESFSEEERTVKHESSPDNEFVFFEKPVQAVDPEDLPERFIASIRTHSRFDPELVDRVACVISRSTGYDHLVEQADRLGDVPLGSLSEYATEAVADHNLTISLALLKDLNRQQTAMRDFNRSNLTGYDPLDSTVGVVGVGKIGEATARRFMRLGVSVQGHDIRPKSHLESREDFTYRKLDPLFETSDLVILCLPHTDQTEDMIGLDQLLNMPEGSFLVNSGRGEVVSPGNLLVALNDGPLEGLGIDVYRHEDELADCLQGATSESEVREETRVNLKLVRDDRVIATPHNAFNSRGSLRTKVRKTLDNIESFNESGALVTPIDQSSSS